MCTFILQMLCLHVLCHPWSRPLLLSPFGAHCESIFAFELFMRSPSYSGAFIPLSPPSCTFSRSAGNSGETPEISPDASPMLTWQRQHRYLNSSNNLIHSQYFHFRNASCSSPFVPIISVLPHSDLTESTIFFLSISNNTFPHFYSNRYSMVFLLYTLLLPFFYVIPKPI